MNPGVYLYACRYKCIFIVNWIPFLKKKENPTTKTHWLYINSMISSFFLFWFDCGGVLLFFRLTHAPLYLCLTLADASHLGHKLSFFSSAGLKYGCCMSVSLSSYLFRYWCIAVCEVLKRIYYCDWLWGEGESLFALPSTPFLATLLRHHRFVCLFVCFSGAYFRVDKICQSLAFPFPVCCISR